MRDLTFKAPDGSATSLAAFAGKTVLVNLWATWCVPCRAEMPALDRLEAALGGDAFSVVAINVDVRNPERARAFLDEIGVKQLAFYADPSFAIFNELKKRGLASACRRRSWSTARAAASASSKGRRHGIRTTPRR